MDQITTDPPRRGIALQALIPMRREPAEQAEMVSQLLFGEKYTVMETSGKWIRIETFFDRYEGWIDRKLFQEAPPGFSGNPTDDAVQFARIAEVTLPDGTWLLTPAGSSLPCLDEARKTLLVSGLLCQISSPFGYIVCPPEQNLLQTAIQFLHAPYVWGGRSPFGFDCSGLVQTVFHIHGTDLPRDASQQFLAGENVSSLRESEPGDLAFFASGSGKITHVGILDGLGSIVHCSGKVRIDLIRNEGIYHAESGELTHSLAGIRRITG